MRLGRAGGLGERGRVGVVVRESFNQALEVAAVLLESGLGEGFSALSACLPRD